MKIFQNYTKVSKNNLNPVYTALHMRFHFYFLVFALAITCSKPSDPAPHKNTLSAYVNGNSQSYRVEVSILGQLFQVQEE